MDVERRFYDGDHVVLDFIQDGWGEPIELEHRYLYDPAVDQVLAQEDVPNSHDPYLATIRTLWLLTDNQGTIRDVVNNAGGTITGGHFQYGRIKGEASQIQQTPYQCCKTPAQVELPLMPTSIAPKLIPYVLATVGVRGSHHGSMIACKRGKGVRTVYDTCRKKF